MKSDQKILRVRNVVEGSLINRVGLGSTFLFLEDVWCSPNSLKNIFPRLYSILIKKGHLHKSNGCMKAGDLVLEATMVE